MYKVDEKFLRELNMSNVYNQGLILMHREWDRELSRKMGKSWEQVIYRRNKIVKKKNTWNDVWFL